MEGVPVDKVESISERAWDPDGSYDEVRRTRATTGERAPLSVGG